MPPGPTPTQAGLPRRLGDFATLAEALDYAADGGTGLNFHNGKGEIAVALPYRSLRDRALSLARRLLRAGLVRGDRVAIVAETHPDVVARVLRLPVRRPGAGAAAAARPPSAARTPMWSISAAWSERRGRARCSCRGRWWTGWRPFARDGRARRSAAVADCCRTRRRTAAPLRAVAAGGRRLPAVLVGQHALPHRRRGAPAGADGQRAGDPAARAAGAPGRPRGVLAAALPRHGAGRLPAGAAARRRCRWTCMPTRISCAGRCCGCA